MRSLVVKLTSGVEALERANQAFTVASTAAASGVTTSLWLTGDAVWLAVPGYAEKVELPYASPMAELRDGVLALGRLTACTQCVKRRELEQPDLIKKPKRKGLRRALRMIDVGTLAAAAKTLLVGSVAVKATATAVAVTAAVTAASVTPKLEGHSPKPAQATAQIAPNASAPAVAGASFVQSAAARDSPSVSAS